MNGLISVCRCLSDRTVFAASGESDPQPKEVSNRVSDAIAPKASSPGETWCPDPDTDGTGLEALAQWMAALNATIDVPVQSAPDASGATLVAPQAGEASSADVRAGRGTFDPSAFRSNQVMESNVSQVQFLAPVCYETASSPSRMAVDGAGVALAGSELRNVLGDALRDAMPVTVPEPIGADATDRIALNASLSFESSAIPRTVPERFESRRSGAVNTSLSTLLRAVPAWQTPPISMVGADVPTSRTERTPAEPVQVTGETLPGVIGEPAVSAPAQAARTETGLQTSPSGVWDAATRMSTERWGPQLMSALGERINVHAQLGVERAIIRLDPQSMGTLQIDIRREGGALQIQFIASHEDVARQLLDVSHDLRQQLEGRQHGDVSVLVRHGHGLGQGGGAASEDDADTPESKKPPGTALAEADVGYADARFHLDDR